jgi:MFS family permease
MTARTERSTGTFSALHNLDFRIYFAGQLASTSGTWMQSIAQGWLVYQLTHSELWLGIVACATGLPLLLLSPAAGVLVERVSRQQMMIVTQTIQMILAFILAALTVTNTVQIWHIVVLALLLGITNAGDSPARIALTADLVEREQLPSGIALSSILINGSRVIGPTVAGLVLTTLGSSWCFLLNGLSFLAVIASLLAIKVKPVKRLVASESPVRQLQEGLRYALSHSLILPLLLLTANAGLLGIGVLTLTPAYAAVVLHSPTNGYVLMNAANGLGAVFAAFLMGWFARRIGLARTVAAMALLTAVSMGFLASTATIAIASSISFVFGLALITQFVGASTLIQLEVPNEFRGRVLALYSLAFAGLTPFGSLALGLTAARIGIATTIVVTAIVTGLVSLVILFRWIALWQRRKIPEKGVGKIEHSGEAERSPS